MRRPEHKLAKELFLAIQKLEPAKARALADRFISKLITSGRTALAKRVVNELEKMMKTHDGVVSVVLTTARKLTSVDKTALHKEVGRAVGAGTEIAFESDPTIGGGVVIVYGDTMLDESIAGRIARLKSVII